MTKLNELINVKPLDLKFWNADERAMLKKTVMEVVDETEIDGDSDLAQTLKEAHQKGVELLAKGYRVIEVMILHRGKTMEQMIKEVKKDDLITIGGIVDPDKDWEDKLMHLVSTNIDTIDSDPEKITEIPKGATRVTIHGKFVRLGRHSGPQIDMDLMEKFNCFSPFSYQIPPYQFGFSILSGDNPKEQALLDYLNAENKRSGQRVEFEFEE